MTIHTFFTQDTKSGKHAAGVFLPGISRQKAVHTYTQTHTRSRLRPSLSANV